MSNGMNKVTLFGNLGATPELRATPTGASVLKLRLATNRSWVNKEGVREEETEWHHVAVFGRRGEGLARVLRKGSFLLVEGRLRTHSYEKDGSRRYFTEIVAEDVVLGGRGARHPEAEATDEADAEAHTAADAWADTHLRPAQPDDAGPSERPEPAAPPDDAGPSERPEPATPPDDVAAEGGPSSEDRRAPEVFDPVPLDPKPRRGGGHGGAAEAPLPPPRKRTRVPADVPALAA